MFLRVYRRSNCSCMYCKRFIHFCGNGCLAVAVYFQCDRARALSPEQTLPRECVRLSCMRSQSCSCYFNNLVRDRIIDTKQDEYDNRYHGALEEPVVSACIHKHIFKWLL